MLLTRDKFRNAVFERDGHKCVICGVSPDEAKGVRIDAHHILERRLWSDGGYYLDNGATLCDHGNSNGFPMGCHSDAEVTTLSVEDIRIAAGITKIKIPEDMYPDHVYDKWGNTILSNGKRSIGPLFYDESVQKILRYHPDFDGMFVDYVKFPRTYHCPWSQTKTKDDRVLTDMKMFEGRDVVVTEKMDGENFSGYRAYCHARSIDGLHHESRDWAKNFWLQRSYELPEGWRVTAENLYAVHSIRYDNLKSYLYGFGVWNERNICLSWDDAIEWFELLGMESVPVLYRGAYDEEKIKRLWNESMRDTCEGYVIRLADEFHYRDYKTSVAKYVRKDHVHQHAKHWKHSKIEVNGIETND